MFASIFQLECKYNHIYVPSHYPNYQNVSIVFGSVVVCVIIPCEQITFELFENLHSNLKHVLTHKGLRRI